MRKSNSWLLLAVVAMTISLGTSDAWSAESETSLTVGVTKIDITPEDPVRMSGYGSRKELSTGIHDRLFARVVSLESSGNRLVLVSTDLIGFYRTFEPIREAICDRFDLKPSQLFLSSTHTHSGPTPTLTGGIHPNNLKYTRGLKKKLLDAVGQAIESHEPVQMGVGRGYSPVGSNRREKRPDGSIRLGRNPYGPTDKEVLVMKLAKPNDTPIAALFDYATHATSLGPKNLTISGDVMGIAAQYVEKILGQEVLAPVFAGASGDIDPWYRVLPSFKTENGWIPETELLGTLLGAEVLHVFTDINTAAAATDIKTGFATLELPAKENTEGGGDDTPTKNLNVTVARIGNVGFVGLGCELLTEIGMEIKAHSPFDHTFVITHCNGGAGYLAPSHLYAAGGYEINSTRFAPEAGDILVKRTVQMLQELK